MNTQTQAFLAKLRDLPNHGREHVFLGDPHSHGCDKTCVEPGNIYSPGIWSCGVSVCVADGDTVLSPLLLDETELTWGFSSQEGFAPILASSYALGNLVVRHRLCHRGGEGNEGMDCNEVTLTTERQQEVLFGVLLRDIGPAGGQIHTLEWDNANATLVVDGSLRLVLESGADGCDIAPADQSHDSPAAVVFKRLRLDAGRPVTVHFRTEHNYLRLRFTRQLIRRARGTPTVAAQALKSASQSWKKTVPAQVFTPDPRVARAWNACAYHILAAMECAIPRIAAVNYPIFWMRDGVIILRALDMFGRHDLARSGCVYLAPLMFSGGFGAESDAPGEAIWALVSHALITGDRAWLKQIFPQIKQRIKYLDRMRTTKRVLHAVTENRTPSCVNLPDSTVLCLPSVNGLIHGRMDGHSPDFFINCWAAAGYAWGAEAAAWIGERRLAAQWHRSAECLQRAVARHLLPGYGNDRDPIVTPWPTRTLMPWRKRLTVAFGGWFRSRRLTADGCRRGEPEWTYFEAAQIHNAILLGFVQEAWVCLDGMLTQEPGRDVFAYAEGPPDGNEALPFRNDIGKRGWLDPTRARGGNMPHNWTSAEMIGLIREMLVYEDDDGLVLGIGVPDSWRMPGAEFGVRQMPTALGPVSYRAQFTSDGSVRMVNYRGPKKWRWPDQLTHTVR